MGTPDSAFGLDSVIAREGYRLQKKERGRDQRCAGPGVVSSWEVLPFVDNSTAPLVIKPDTWGNLLAWKEKSLAILAGVLLQ
jgi:hypothetical protein